MESPPFAISPFRHFALIDNRSQKVGCPIRKFPDQSLFAAPRDLSQRTTSFIASQRQGIRRIPFWHLIHARNQKTDGEGFTPPRASSDRKDQFCFKHIRDLCGQAKITTGMLSNDKQMTDDNRQQGFRPARHRANHSLVAETGCASSSQCQFIREPTRQPKPDIRPPRPRGRLSFQGSRPAPDLAALARNHDPQTHISSEARAARWWSQTGSNRRPHACKARALPTELWPLGKAVGLRQ
jgi:hypothetical protein